METYLNLLKHVKTHGNIKSDRTGVGTQSVFGHQIRFDLSKGFPLLTTKKLHLKSIIYELLWFINGDTNIKYLQWRTWRTESGEVIDQLTQVINLIKKDPDSRRLIVSAWNVGDLPKMALSPCHCLFQFYVSDGKLSCQLYQRSADLFLGVPFNIASYALLTMMIAQVTGYEPGDFIHTFGDLHLYSNHMEQVELQLSREPLPLPTMKINQDVKSILDFTYEDFKLENYQSHPAIKAPIAV